MKSFSELQRNRVLSRWKKQQTREAARSVKEPEGRKLLLTRLIGYLQGDGSICVRNDRNVTKYHVMFCPDHIIVAELYGRTFEELFGRKTQLVVYQNYFRVRITHKGAAEELLSLAKFRGMQWEIPTICDTEERLIEWLRAYYDCEAYVGKRCIVVNSVNKKGLLQVKDALQQLGIVSKWYEYRRKQANWNRNYILTILRREARQTFLKRVGFNHPVKQQKLEAQFATVG